MASILFKGQALEMYRDESIRLEREGPWLQEQMQDELSLPFKLPWEGSANKRLLQHLNVPQAIVRRTRIPVLLTLEGRQRLGEMVLRGVRQELTVNIYIIASQLSVLDKELPELDIPQPLSLNQLYADGISKVWPEAKCYFPMIRNRTLYDDLDTDPPDRDNEHYEFWVNQYDTNTGTYTENYIQNGEKYNVNTLIPMVPLMEVLQTALAIDGYSLKGAWYESEVWRRAFLLNNRTLDVENTYAARMDQPAWGSLISPDQVLNVGFKHGQGTGADPSNDRYTVSHTQQMRATFLARIDEADVLNDPYASGFIEAWLLYDGVQYDKAFFGPGAGSQNIELSHDFSWAAADLGKHLTVQLNNPTQAPNAPNKVIALSLSSVRLKVELVGIKAIEFAAPSNLNQHLPTVRVAELFNRLQSDLNLALITDYDAKTIELRDRNSIRNEPPAQDLTAYQQGGLQVDFEDKQELLIRHRPPTEYEEKKRAPYGTQLLIDKQGRATNVPERPYGFDGQVKELEISPLMDAQVSFVNIDWLGFRDTGISAVIDTGADMLSRVSLSFVAQKGNYLTAVNRYDTVDLSLAQAPGSIGESLAQWHNFRQLDPRTFKAQLLLPRFKLAQLSEEQPLTLSGVPYIIKRLEYELTADGELTPVTLTLLAL